MTSFFLIMGIPLTIVLLFFTCLYQSVQTQSTYNKKIKPHVRSVFNRNKLYVCEYSTCQRFMRRYQIDLMAMKHGYHLCPHCMRSLSYSRIKNDYGVPVSDADEWVDTHRDCFKVTIRQFTKLKKSVREIQEYQQAEAVNDRFEQYEKRNPDTTWMDNLQKIKGAKWYD